ncbi:MAG: adenine-specific DNA-methyltransferase [Solirubrobacteraceae bacterium]|nr:adenine-specific DNA-methyltransferase [Solirubrobacteraceae bacterium]
MIKYLGSKRTLVPLIERVVGELPARTACDLFAGTTRVGQALRRRGLAVLSNDTASYSEAFGRAYVQAGPEVDRAALRRRLAELDALPGQPGYFTRAFCHQARYLRPENGARVDAIRAAIDELDVSEVERGLLLTSLVEAADRVDSTVGLQMAYLKRWAPRARNPLALREPEAVPGPCGSVAREDAGTLAPALDVDLVYVDPPYNQHSYFSNYHVWETLVRGDEPDTYGVANKRVDCRERKSPWNSRRTAPAALEDLLERVEAPWLLVSLNAEGFHDPAAVGERLAQRGYVARLPVGVKRYVGAQIGIHAPDGRKVGRVSHVRTTEYLLLAGPDRAVVERAGGLAPAAVAA